MLSGEGDKGNVMENLKNWAFPSDLRPRSEDVRFDLDTTLDSMVQLRAEVPEDAFTASILGTDRSGNGVVIQENGLVLTIGYLITEASSIWLTTNRGTVVAGDPVAYDPQTGFGLVQPLGQLAVPPMARGTIASCRVGDVVVVAGYGGRAHALKASVFAMREFAGYWEYVLDTALFTLPAHPQWGGAALISDHGRLLGIGSLLVEEKVDGETVQGNMTIPIDLLEPILEDMLRLGRPDRPPRPWLGMYTTEVGRHLVIAAVAERAPASLAGLQVGDIVVEVAGEHVSGLANLFRRIWRVGEAGAEVPLTIARKGEISRVVVRSADRNDFLRKRSVH